jgi:tetratricopeptide (TPR) repeat protein
MNRLIIIWISLQCFSFSVLESAGHAQTGIPSSIPETEEPAEQNKKLQPTGSDENQTAASSTSSSNAIKNEIPPNIDEQMRVANPYLIRGEKLFGEGNYDAALAEFEKAHEILKGHPKQYQTLYNIGLCHERLFRYDQALRFYNQYLKRCRVDDEHRNIVKVTVETLQGLLATLRVKVNVKAEIWVDDRLIGYAPSDVLVPGGRHTIELRAGGYEAFQKELQIPARSERTIEIRLKIIKEYHGLHPVFFWSGAAITLTAFGIGTYYGVQALEKSDSFGEFDPLYNPDVKKDIDNLVLLYFMSDFGEDTEDKPEAQNDDTVKVRVNCFPIIERNRAEIRVRGLF